MDQPKFDPRKRYDVLCHDLTDVAVWLKEKYPTEKFVLAADYYQHQKFSKEIACIVILESEREKCRAIRAAATQAMEAFGWRIVSEGGGDVIDAEPNTTKDLSAHELLRAISRVENVPELAMKA
jgi:hypothetical protein